MESKKNKKSYINVIFLILLFLYPLRNVHLGVDVWDGGYNYANFSYSGLEHMDSMWYFATWLSNTFGNFLTKLPFGDCMLGMNVYTTLIISIITVSSFVFCVRKLHIPSWMVFVGELLAVSLCWAPAAVLYNYLTYGFLLCGTILLYQGLTTDQNRYLVLAGVVLGLNVGTRFSNLVHTGLILAVWYYAFICKKKFTKVLQETGFCILGYAGAFGLFLIMISAKYGFGNYVESIKRLFVMTETATDYAPDSMLLGMVKAYLDNTSTYWLKRFALVSVVTCIICCLLPKGWRVAKKVVSSLLIVVFMLWIVKKGYCTLDYTTYNSIYYPVIIILLMAIVLLLIQICNNNIDKKQRLFAMLMLLTIYLTSLGGNNAIYSSINNLFMVLPYFFWMSYCFLKKNNHILFYPFKTILLTGIVLLLVQGFRFGNIFVYEEATGARDLTTEITEVPVLKGMHTAAAKAEALESLYQYLQENNLQDRECILYGDIPGIAYYMELSPAINIWSDLRSYSVDTMVTDLERLEQKLCEGKAYPIVIFNKKYAGYYAREEEQYLPEEQTARQKMIHLCLFMEKHGYKRLPCFENESFEVFMNWEKNR